jgi:hypothetical protein
MFSHRDILWLPIQISLMHQFSGLASERDIVSSYVRSEGKRSYALSSFFFRGESVVRNVFNPNLEGNEPRRNLLLNSPQFCMVSPFDSFLQQGLPFPI